MYALLLIRVLYATEPCLLRPCLAMKKGITFTKFLPGNDGRDTHTDRLTDERDS
jgi:hypothetical protein